MNPKRSCPKCGADISDSYDPADPDVGILTGGWYCGACDEPVADYEADDDYEKADFR